MRTVSIPKSFLVCFRIICKLTNFSMASINRDNQKQAEKYKNILAIILSREDNKFCADCLAKGKYSKF